MKFNSRRNFLKTLGLGAGASLFSPFFNSLAWAETKGDMPRRYVFVVEGNCVEPITMLSTKGQAALEASAGHTIAVNWTKRNFFNMYTHEGSPLIINDMDFETASALGAVIEPSGGVSLGQDTAVLLGLSSKITGGSHSTNHGALSCSLSAPGQPGGQTIDAYLAALPAVRKNTPFDAVRLGTSSKLDKRLNFDTCAFGVARPAPIILHPAVAYNSLFGSVASAVGKAAFDERKDLLSFAKEDVNIALNAFSGNSRERAKLEKYLESLESLAQTQQILLGMEDKLLANKPLDPSENPLYGKVAPYLYDGEDCLQGLAAQFELATAALKGDLTNVAVIASGTGLLNFDVGYKSVPGAAGLSRHELHHESTYGGEYFGNNSLTAAIHEISRRHANMVCKLARDLAATPEPNGDGSMLDHTVIVYMSDNGEQHHSKAMDWPMLVIGGKKLGLSLGGRTLIYPTLGQTGHRQVSNFFNTLGHTAGQNLNMFGKEGPKRIKPGPLDDIYG